MGDNGPSDPVKLFYEDRGPYTSAILWRRDNQYTLLYADARLDLVRNDAWMPSSTIISWVLDGQIGFLTETCQFILNYFPQEEIAIAALTSL